MSKITPSITITVIENGKQLVKKQFQQDKIILGRILSADLRIPSMRVSRIHALIENLEDGHYRITDLASTHGTFVNGDRVVERILKAGDSLKLADIEVNLEYEVYPTLTAVPKPKDPSIVAPRASVERAPFEGASSSQVALDPQGSVSVQTPREATVIRSLKETARTRGALDPTSKPHEEMELTVYWEEAVLAVEHYKKDSKSIYIGDGIESDYIVPVTEFPNKFLFVELKNNLATLHLHPVMKASVRHQGNMYTGADLAKIGQSSVNLSGSDIAKIQVGSVNFFIMFVPEPPRIPRAPLFDQGKLYWGSLAIAILMACALGVFGLLMRAPIEGQVKEFPEKYRKIIVEAYKKKAEKKVEVSEEKSGAENAQKVTPKPQKGGNEAQGAKEAGTEGKRGEKTAKAATGITNRPKIAKTKTQDAPKKATRPVKTKSVQRKPIKKQTLLESLKNSGIGARVAKATGDAGAAGQDSLDKALQGTGGGGIRSARGSGGSGLQGAAQGGGGKAVGVGGLGTQGFGGGAKGDGVGSLPGKGEADVSSESVGVSVVGSLTREEIERVIRAHINEIKACYQAELQRNPSVFGKIKLQWTIIGGGKATAVSTAQNTTGSSALVNCIKARLRTWTFPSPRGGSTATVDYPWLFKPKGS
ncbi:AgmX/PglI C-terminal domain-containing protein [bacterium]|nr:AgmX/PglI C-terminal domain-containing protein [bacterium]